jgi:hypothetical protein
MLHISVGAGQTRPQEIPPSNFEIPPVLSPQKKTQRPAENDGSTRLNSVLCGTECKNKKRVKHATHFITV